MKLAKKIEKCAYFSRDYTNFIRIKMGCRSIARGYLYSKLLLTNLFLHILADQWQQ